jgi:isopenicillin N synthase-like dioxygenase
MTNSKNEIPVIDISPFLNGSDKKGVAEKVTNACKNIGFLIISGHGIEPTTVKDAFRKSRQFFNLEQKKKNLYHPQKESQQRGYHAFATRGLAYTLGRDAPPDLRETYFLGPINDHRKYFQASPEALQAYAPNIMPDQPEGFSVSLENIYTSYQRLSEDILRIFSISLDLDESFFSKLITRHFSILSSHYYPPLQKPPVPGQLRTGAHTDFGAITILAMTKAAGGLEVLMPDDTWQAVRPKKNELVVNLGDMMALWTNGIWKSTLHRVVNPEKLHDERSQRQTIGYFMHPDYDALIKTIPTCITKERPKVFEEITAGEHIAKKIRASHEGTI